ncbi:hypothetical protein LCR_10180 [Aeromonas enteropelogenes]|uniref:Uncharacterized protein n=1 Tax=Aeromonas enteropelogenes TaxID=29489 RepID=A0A175VIV8_AEREN|nr:hypothetical protein LCR_10180 [Aeromonas enteropelogenes]
MIFKRMATTRFATILYAQGEANKFIYIITIFTKTSQQCFFYNMFFQLPKRRLFYLHPFNQCLIRLLDRTDSFCKGACKFREITCFWKH